MSDECSKCVVATASRRAFLRDVGLAVVGAIALTTAASPAVLLAESVTETKPSGIRGAQRIYGIPSGDSIAVDEGNNVIIARWQNSVYAFSLKCPHRGARLEWRADERRIFCPKHKARFAPNGTHDSGRRSRDLDRYDISRQAESLIVDLDALRRADQDSESWRAAVIQL